MNRSFSLTITHLLRMMHYLEISQFQIPSYNIPYPDEVYGNNGKNYRAEKTFALKLDGTMTYIGSAVIPQKGMDRIEIQGIKLSQQWIDRAYLHLVNSVQRRVEDVVSKAGQLNVRESKLRQELIMRFNGLDFCSVSDSSKHS